MCGRFSLYFFPDAEEEFEKRFGIPFPTSGYIANYNIAPGTHIPVVKSDLLNSNQIADMHWGLIPWFAKEFKPHPVRKMSNTRAEVFHETKDHFRKELLQTSRCIVAANNYFEWRTESGQKMPYKIERNDRYLLTMGAIYSGWKGPNGERQYSCSIITTPPSDSIKHIHDRMPFILDDQTEQLWLDRTITDYQVVRDAITTYRSDGLRYFLVSRRVNYAKNNDSQLIVPVSSHGGQSDLFSSD